MNYEQKYNEALNDMRAIYPNLKGDAKLAVEHAFPELTESEDERIRKELIEALKTSKTVGELKFILPEPTREECIAYLEKQKELPFVKDVVLGLPGLYFYDGERMHFQGNPATEENPYDFAMSQQEKQKEQKPWKVGANAYFTPEQKPAQWDVEQQWCFEDVIALLIADGHEREANVLKTLFNQSKIGLSKKEIDNAIDDYNSERKQEWSEEDEEILNELLDHCNTENATWYNWLKSLRPKRVNVSDQTLQLLICYLHGCHDVAKRDGEKADCRRYISYLEDLDYTLKNRWKPSEEQMKALIDCVIGNEYDVHALVRLWAELKKL